MKDLKLKYDSLLFSGAKLNFQTIPDLNLIKKDLSFIHLISSVVPNGYLKEINFHNASLLSTKFSESTFEECNLTSTDIFSVWFKDCNFKKSNFSDSTISDSTFVNCVFDHSIMDSISLTNCQFIDCTFENMPIDDSDFSLNTFIRCKIKNTSFTETFYYQLFEDCEFFDVNMSPDLLGFNFGFSKEVLQQLSKSVDLQEIETEFINKGLFVNAAILRINQVQNYYDIAIVACITALAQMLNHDLLIKADEIRFLKQLTIYFFENNHIAPVSILQIWQILNNIRSNAYNIAIDKSMPYINEYINELYFIYQHFLENLQKKLYKLSSKISTEGIVELKVVYAEKPSIPFLEFLSKITELIGPDCPKPIFIKAVKGSFKEFHEIATVIIPYLETLFGLLGVVVPIAISHREKINRGHETTNKNNPQSSQTKDTKDSIEITVSHSMTSSITTLPNTTPIKPETNAIITDTIKILNTQPILDNADFCGYNAQNINSITINFK